MNKKKGRVQRAKGRNRANRFNRNALDSVLSYTYFEDAFKRKKIPTWCNGPYGRARRRVYFKEIQTQSEIFKTTRK